MRITVERNIKQDISSKQYYVTFYYGKDENGKNKRKTRSFSSLEVARIELKNTNWVFRKTQRQTQHVLALIPQ